jgi:hypothetical protein
MKLNRFLLFHKRFDFFGNFCSTGEKIHDLQISNHSNFNSHPVDEGTTFLFLIRNLHSLPAAGRRIPK